MNSLFASNASTLEREPATLRAATTLGPSLQAAAQAPDRIRAVWRANEWLQSDLQAGHTASGFAALDGELHGRGWPHGQLVELLVDQPGTGELSLLLPALAAVSKTGGTMVWVLPCRSGAASGAVPPEAAQSLPYAPALQEAGVDLARSIFVRPLTARESAWALEQSLRAAHVGAVIGWLPEGNSSEADFRCLRRLHLLAQQHQSLVFALRAARHARSPSPAALRMQLSQQNGQLQLRLLKRRGRPMLEPIALQIHPAEWSRAPAPVPAPAGTRHAAAQPSLLERMRALAPVPTQGWSLEAALGH